MMRVRSLAVIVVVAALAGSCGTEDPPLAPVANTIPPTPTPAPTPTPTPVSVAEPTPVPTPDTCPPLTRWSSRIFNITDAEFKLASTPTLGGYVVIDSTPLFSGRECNAEHDNCGGRRCEDPRGGHWVFEGNSSYQIREGGYQARIGPLNGGTHSWQVCPRAGARDGEGEPVTVIGDACSEGSFFVPYN